MKIVNKGQMHMLYQTGRFGNKLRSWNHMHHFTLQVPADTTDRFCLRYRGDNPGRWSAYNLSRDDVFVAAEKWRTEGANPLLIAVNEVAPDDQLLIQGEIARSIRHYDLMYSTKPGLRMNEIRLDPSYASGRTAVALLKRYLDPASYDDLQLLLDTYEDAVVEFSTYAVDLGDIPRRNTVFWEVRNY
jgi:hypothetical protein